MKVANFKALMDDVRDRMATCFGQMRRIIDMTAGSDVFLFGTVNYAVPDIHTALNEDNADLPLLLHYNEFVKTTVTHLSNSLSIALSGSLPSESSPESAFGEVMYDLCRATSAMCGREYVLDVPVQNTCDDFDLGIPLSPVQIEWVTVIPRIAHVVDTWHDNLCALIGENDDSSITSDPNYVPIKKSKVKTGHDASTPVKVAKTQLSKQHK